MKGISFSRSDVLGLRRTPYTYTANATRRGRAGVCVYCFASASASVDRAGAGAWRKGQRRAKGAERRERGAEPAVAGVPSRKEGLALSPPPPSRFIDNSRADGVEPGAGADRSGCMFVFCHRVYCTPLPRHATPRISWELLGALGVIDVCQPQPHAKPTSHWCHVIPCHLGEVNVLHGAAQSNPTALLAAPRPAPPRLATPRHAAEKCTAPRWSWSCTRAAAAAAG